MEVRVAVLTVSDQSAHGERADTSGDRIASWTRDRGFEMTARAVVPDESDLIARQLIEWSDDRVANLILTTGGTGLGPRDVTPEATRAVLDREAPGIAEAIRHAGSEQTPRSILSRALCGARGETLIVNLPGSPSGVDDGLGVLAPIVEHAVQILAGQPTDH